MREEESERVREKEWKRGREEERKRVREGEREEESKRVPLYFLLLIVIRKLRPALVNSVFKYLGTGRGTRQPRSSLCTECTRFTGSIEIICPPLGYRVIGWTWK